MDKGCLGLEVVLSLLGSYGQGWEFGIVSVIYSRGDNGDIDI